MSEQRRITVERTASRLQEYDREVEVSLHNSAIHSTTLRLTRLEARDLMLQISNHLWRLEGGKDES